MEGTVAVGIVKDIEKNVVAIPGHAAANRKGKK
jgi:hypothetical protein